MTDLLITDLSTKQMETVAGGGGFTMPQINLNINVAPKLNFNLNLGVIVVAGNTLFAPLNINLNQFI